MHNMNISIKNIPKVEGHTHLDVTVRNGVVKDVRLKVSENKRFYTQAIRGKKVGAVPQMVARICGTCSVAHLLASTEAVEKAVGLEISPQTIILRKLLVNGSMIRDHAMHLYLFCLPDLLGKDSVLDFSEEQHKWLHDCFDVKGVGNNLCKLIAGRAIHPPNAVIGGFTEFPDNKKLREHTKTLKEMRERVLDLIELFFNSGFSWEREVNYVSLVTEDYGFLEGNVCSSSGLCIPESEYWNHLNRVVIPYSTSTAFEFEGKEYMVGALARLNMNKEKLHRNTKRDAQKFLSVFPSNDLFHNNLAQAIEILHCIDYSTELIECNEFKQEKIPEIKPRAASGVGVIEAPRGTLYHMISSDKDGTVTYGNLVIPTAQNQIQMEKDIRNYLPKILGKPKKEISLELEKLLRAYDPCMSCATHFLKVNWK